MKKAKSLTHEKTNQVANTLGIAGPTLNHWVATIGGVPAPARRCEQFVSLVSSPMSPTWFEWVQMVPGAPQSQDYIENLFVVIGLRSAMGI